MNVSDLIPDKDRYEAFAAKYYPGFVHIRECLFCSKMEWSTTETKKPNGFSVAPSNPYNCSMCTEVGQRNPEIFKWVTDCIAHSMKSILKETREAILALTDEPKEG